MTTEQTSQQILEEVRALRASLNEFAANTERVLIYLETQVSSLASASTPGPVLVAASPRRSTRRPS